MMNEEKLSEVWPQLLAKIRPQLSPHSFETWFSSLKPLNLDKGVLTLGTPDQFFNDWIKEHYGGLLEEKLKELGLKNGKINFVLAKPEAKQETFSLSSPIKLKTDLGEKSRFNPLYSFENFVVGPSNRFAHAASLAVAESPAKAYNPLFIYGGVGLGKTHLLQAIGQFISSHNPGIKLTYISSEEFTNQLINSIQNRTTLRFRERYRNVDVLLLDDIYFIAGKESTQEEFFHTFNTLYDSHKQIVLSSDRSPKDIQGLEERLVSRFGWGLVTDIQPPDFETRAAILRKKAELAGVEVPQAVILFIAEKIKTNIRELEGALIRVCAQAKLAGEEITLEGSQKVLRDMIHEEEKMIAIEDIQRKVAEHFGIRFTDMRTKKRNQAVAFPRQIAMYLARELTNYSLPEIGMYFGGKDHTTILHAWSKINRAVKLQKELKDKIEKLLKELRQIC